MAQTQIPFGHPLARKVFGAAVFAEVTRMNTFGTGRLVGPAPQMGETGSKLEQPDKAQTNSGFPIIRVTDLSKGRGDTVSVDMFNIVQGKPVMGDTKLSGKMMALNSSSQDLKINQIRGGVDPGGRMAQQRTVHNLRTVGMRNLAGWYSRFADQWRIVHLSGDRGSMNTTDWVIPLATDPDFETIMVNQVDPPTYNRHFYAGDATNLEDLDSADILTLDDIDRLRAAIDEADVPLQPVMLPDDPNGWDEPLYVLLVSTRQWHYLQTRTGEKAWRTFLSNAMQRGSSNPLFKGNPGMWNSILVKKTQRVCRFNEADVVTVATSAAVFATETKTIPAFGGTAANNNVDRAVLLGAQGLAEVYGRHMRSGTHFNWHEEETDHGNTVEASIAAMGGCQKLRFRDSAGYDTDYGVMVLDSYAPDPRYVRIA